MKITDIKKTAIITDAATIGTPGYGYDETTATYQIWDGNQWIGNFRDDGNGNLVRLDLADLLK